MAAVILKTPQIAITAEESKRLAEALKNLSQYYNITPNPQVMAWVQLLTVAAAIYGPRFALLAMQAKQKRANEARGFPSGVQGVTPQPQPAPRPSGIPGAFEAPPPAQGVYKFQ